MYRDFTAGDEIRLSSGDMVTIISKIGEGGQGKVYKVAYKDKEYALKWYFANRLGDPKRFFNNLNNNTIKGSPSKEFLWPLAVTEEHGGSFGYIMELRPDEFKDFAHILNAKVKYKNTDVVVNAGLNMINAFMQLHKKGFSYQDLNDGNFFINPENGDVLICDNDNVAPWGESFGVAGKSRYMAPEIVVGTNKPNLDTDLFSLSVILFMLIFIAHPFDGARVVACPCLTEEFEYKLYGENPVFVWDPDDDSNRPVRGIHSNLINLWPLFPRYLHDAFIQSLGKGAKTINSRLRETEWRDIFIRLKDDIIWCDNCGEENFASISNQGLITCFSCNHQNDRPLSLINNDFNIPLYPRKNITAWHVGRGDYSEVIGGVVKNKKNPKIWGLRNLSDFPWVYKLPDNSDKVAKKGEVIPIFKDVSVEIMNKIFEIR